MRQLIHGLTTTVLLLLFAPLFGLGGTHFRLGSVSGRKGLMDWMTYSLLHRRLLIQTTKGRTAFTYTVWGVSPLRYLKFSAAISRGDQRAMERLLKGDEVAHEVIWRWRWDGAYTPGPRRVAA